MSPTVFGQDRLFVVAHLGFTANLSTTFKRGRRGMTSFVAVYSMKGGVGKSTLAANLA